MGRAARAKWLRKMSAPKPAITANLPASGLGGLSEYIVMRPVFGNNPSDPRNSIPPGGAPGKYRVVFTFARPGYTPVPEREFSMDPDLPGDSHLAIAPPAIQPAPGVAAPNAIEIVASTAAVGDEILFTGYPNKAGFLGRIVATIEATDFKSAGVAAYQALAPSLSNWSAHLDVPFWIWRTHLTLLASGATHISVTNPFANVPFALRGNMSMSEGFRPFASLYREGLSTNSPAYAFLCFYKIAEGVRKRRQRVDAEMVKLGEKPSRPVERVPDDPEEFGPWLNAIFAIRQGDWSGMPADGIFQPEARGRKVLDLLDNELADLRNDIGHALSDDSGQAELVFDDALHLYRLHKWLPLMRCIARRMLKNEFGNEFLPYLSEDGTVGP